jgi:hypothetical protein
VDFPDGINLAIIYYWKNMSEETITSEVILCDLSKINSTNPNEFQKIQIMTGDPNSPKVSNSNYHSYSEYFDNTYKYFYMKDLSKLETEYLDNFVDEKQIQEGLIISISYHGIYNYNIFDNHACYAYVISSKKNYMEVKYIMIDGVFVFNDEKKIIRGNKFPIYRPPATPLDFSAFGWTIRPKSEKTHFQYSRQNTIFPPKHTSMPMGLSFKALINLMPVAAISPAATAPIPRKAPCAQAASDTPPNTDARIKTTAKGASSKPAKEAKAPPKPK